MTYRCNTEGCSLGDCPNCVAVSAALEEEREKLRGVIAGNASAAKSTTRRIHALLDVADVEPNRDYMVRIAALIGDRDEEQARARKAETRVHVLAGHLGMETHDESLAAAAKILRERAEKAEKERAALLAEVDRLQRELYGACGHVGYLVDDEECEYDHDGNCQTHGLGKPCGVEVARRWLATNPTGDPLMSDTEEEAHAD